jgi:hypothetical protein
MPSFEKIADSNSIVIRVGEEKTILDIEIQAAT